MRGYSRQEVQRLLALSEGELRGLLAAGVVSPQRGARRALRFGFQDLVVLRAAKELRSAKVSMRAILKALRALKQQLPSGAALSTVHIAAVGDELVVRDAGSLYAPGSGQLLFDFGVSELREKVRPLAERAIAQANRALVAQKGHSDPDAAERWYALGCDLDDSSPDQARVAYARALEQNPDHVEARINLGRLLHEARALPEAALHYRAALALAPEHAVAWFNLGVVLEDMNDLAGAAEAYGKCLARDASQLDAHHNLGHVLERLGQPVAALRHLSAYRRLMQGPRG